MVYEVKNPGRVSHSEQMLSAFNVYRTTKLLEVLDQPQTFAFIDGLVINSPAKVVSADPHGLVLKVERAQLAALERTRTVVLESPLHGTTFRAAVDAVDHRRAYMCLSSLQPFDAYHERRTQSRAAPAMPLLARLHARGEEASGRVFDLSTRSLAADFETDAFSRVARAPVIRLDVWGGTETSSPLPDFQTTAHVSRSTQRSEDGVAVCRAVLELDSYPALSSRLHRYVARRHRDLLTELLLAGSKPSGETVSKLAVAE